MSEEKYVVEYVTESEQYPKQTREVQLAAEAVIIGLLDGAADGKLEMNEVLSTLTSSVDEFLAAADKGGELIDEHKADPGASVGSWSRFADRIQRAVFRFAAQKKAADEAAAAAEPAGE